jgi:hypothetical protein
MIEIKSLVRINSKALVLLILFIASFLVSCKKGEEDPKLSLRTRKNRVVGKWRLASGKSSYFTKGANGNINYSEGFGFTATNYTYTVPSPSGTGTLAYAGTHYINMNLDKNGDVMFTEIFDGIADVRKGSWNFNAGVGNEKAKEEIILHFQTKENHNGTYFYSGNQKDMTYTLVGLRNKSMKIRAEYTVKNPDGTGSTYIDLYEMIQ